MRPVRIQRKRTKGWRMPENTVYVGRQTKWGNPYKIGDVYHKHDSSWIRPIRKIVRNAGDAVNLYQDHLFLKTMMGELDVSELRGKNLACWCPVWYNDGRRYPCHADILLELANENYKTPTNREEV